MKNTIKIFFGVLIVSMLLFGCQNDKAYPAQNLQGYIMWGAGGGTDTVARSFNPLFEEALGVNLVLQNKTGATGAVATQFVHGGKADGYTVLWGAENPQIYQAMNLSTLSYDDFYPVIITAYEPAIVTVRADSPYQTFNDFIDDALARPGQINFGSTGPGGQPFVVASIINSVNGIELKQTPYDGEGPVLTALLGGHVDITVTKMSNTSESLKNGDVRVLAIVAPERLPNYNDIPAISEFYQQYEKYLPYGAFYGIFVKKETPEMVKKLLSDAAVAAAATDEWKEFCSGRDIVPMTITGAEASVYADNFKRIASWVLYDAGAAPNNPADFKIERIE